MNIQTLNKKIDLLENAIILGTGAYFEFNVTKNVIPGKIYENIGDEEICVNDKFNLPENAKYTDLVKCCCDVLPDEEKEGFMEFFNLDKMARAYKNGVNHLRYTYWTSNIFSKSLLAEQHIILYEDDETKDLLAFTYIMDLTEPEEHLKKLSEERAFLDVLCRDYTSVHYADLNTDVAEPLKVSLSANASEITRIKIRKKINYTENITNYCEKFVTEKYKAEFLKVLSCEYLLDKLSKTDRVVYRYESSPNKAGHCYFEVQAVALKPDDFDGTVIVAFRDVEDIVTVEQKHQRELEKIAYSDALTGLGNRAAFRKALIECDNYPNAACVVADVNNLKLCNDRYGHQEGDKIITDAADSINEAFGGTGRCYRIGGDEFCVLIKNGDIADITQCTVKLEELIKDKNKDRTMPLSMAYGYEIRENTDESIEQLFNRSDEIMYESKFKMKKQFPVYCEERIRNYLNVLSIISKSTESYLYLWDMTRDENWFFGKIDENYAIRPKGQLMNKMEDMVNIVYPDDREMLKNDLRQIAAGVKGTHDMIYRWVNRQGEIVWINCRGTVIYDDEGNPFVMIGRVSDKSLRYFYQPLTKLFNKNKMLKDLKDELMINNSGYFMFIGIDNFSNINLKYGRNYGDEIIKKCAAVFEKKVSLKNIWHVDINCFALYLDVGTEDDVHRIYDELLDELSDVCTLSAGVIQNNIEAFRDENNLYACAEITYEKAKNSEMKTIVFFSQKDLEKRIKELQFLEEMQESVKNGCNGFYLCYQPQIKTGSYDLYGAEALLRYRSEKYGEVYPDEFIPLLEQSKLINEVGLWVLENALLQCRKWRNFKKDFHISVNFSVVQFGDKNIADKVLNILSKTGLSGNALTIEVTESEKFNKINDLEDTFRRWREAGIELSIDDFGTGYASMGYLKQLNVNEIKIDKLFISGIEEATYNYRLVSNMIEFAKSNAIRICCEGVENMRELTVLEELAPNLIQGYLFSKPCVKDIFEKTFIDNAYNEYKEFQEFIQKIYKYKGKLNTVYFNARSILRETELGLWIIRINEKENYCEMHVDDTMERILAVDRKYTPQECYNFWYDRIDDKYYDYVENNLDKMINSDKLVQLQYPWSHPTLGEVIVRCSGKRVDDSDGMITLEGYHRIVDQSELKKLF